MGLLFNDLSVHGQFPDAIAFGVAVARMMGLRKLARQRYQLDLQCHSNVAQAKATRDLSVQEAAQRMGKLERSALMQWLARAGWEGDRQHDCDEYFECKDEVVTNTAVGEAAHRVHQGEGCSLVSMTPSSWLFSPLQVDWHDGESIRCIDVPNYWTAEDLIRSLDVESVSLASWEDLEAIARTRYGDLTFLQDCFKPLRGLPFGKAPAKALLSRLSVLDDLKSCFDENGHRTHAGHEILRKHFRGKKAWFSNSSATEKSKYEQELTFPHPVRNREALFCPWHAKVKTSQLRLHFSWPIHASTPLYVVYVGPKITKR